MAPVMAGNTLNRTDTPAITAAAVDRSMSDDRRGRTRRVLTELLWLIAGTLALTWALRLLLEYALDVPLDQHYWYRDFAGNLVIMLIAWLLTHRLWRAAVAGGLLLVFFQISNGVKLVTLGTPISPDDFFNVQNVFFVFDGWLRVATYAAAAVPALLFVALVRWRHPLTLATLGVLALATTLGVFYSKPLKAGLDRQFGNSVWNQPENYRLRGLGLHMLQEMVRTVAKVGDIPSQEAVHAALQQSPTGAQSIGHAGGRSSTGTQSSDTVVAPALATGSAQRNVHMFVLESFFDPLQLGPELVPDDPLDPAFRELWNASGNSTMLSPVFGGYTANAEFEALCGFPVTENAVFFEGWLRRSVPCLPALLSEQGYTSIASHPNVPGFWNRTQAYKLTGFDTYWSRNDFNLDDSVGGLLMDASYYDQVFAKLSIDGPVDSAKTGSTDGADAASIDEPADTPVVEGPVFNYMLTFFGHLPYPIDAVHHPAPVRAGRDEPLLEGYLNHVWHKSRDLMARLERLKKSDPDALIVIFGDHLPYLGPNYGVHSEVIGLPEKRDDFTAEQFRYLSSTPLIVIDGQNGVLNVGQLPLYRLPSLMLERLGVADRGITELSVNPPGLTIRPMYGIDITFTDHAAEVCTPDNQQSPLCAQSTPWMDRVKTLSADLFTGKQYTLTQEVQN